MMEPHYLLIGQIQQNVAAIEQNLQVLYTREVSYTDKKLVLSYARAQSQQIRQLLDALNQQYRDIEEMMFIQLKVDIELSEQGY
jgi:hypothetical protein